MTASPGAYHATLWNGTAATDLGTLGGSSHANDINDIGKVVGESYTVDGILHAVLWDGASLTDLNLLLDSDTVNAGWVLSSAQSINNQGWIAGVAFNTISNATHGFLLAPVPVPLVSCIGADSGIFDSPMDVPVTVNKRARVLPFKMLLVDENGTQLSDADIAPPMIQVVVAPGATDSAPPPEALDSVGKGDEGNQFSYSDTTWAFNLKTSNFSGSGRYTATVVSSDPSSYVISPTCEGTFYITR